MNKSLIINYLIVVGISIILLIFLSINVKHQPGSHNDISRLAGIIAISRYGELSIDSTIQEAFTVDKVQYKGEFYSSKPPVLNWALGNITKTVFKIKPALMNNDVAIYRFSTLLAVVLPLIGIFITFLFLISDKFKSLRVVNIFFSLFLIFGTLLFSFSSHLNNHIFVAFIQLLIFYIVINSKQISQKIPLYLSLGFLLSIVLVLDVTYSFVCVPITGLYLLFNLERRNYIYILWIFLGAIPLTLFHFGLNYRQFGIFLPPQLYPDIYLSYEGSNWLGNETGIESQNHNFFIRFFNYTFGTYGLFLYQPLLLLPFFIKKNWRSKVWVYVVAILVSYLFFNVFTSPNYGGSAFGPRRFLPIVPMLYYFVVLSVRKLFGTSIFMNILIVILFLFNLTFSYLGFINTWENWNYRTDESGKSLYFPLLYTIRKVLRWYDLEHLLNFLE